MAEKTYYWLKFQRDFFKSLRIKKLRKLAGGDTYTIIYLKLQLLSLTSDGILKYNGIFESFEEEMEEEIGESADNIKITVNYLLSCGLMEKDGDEYFLPFVPINTGSESSGAERQRRFREKKKQKALQCNAYVTDSNVENVTSNTEIDIDKDIDKDIEIDKDKLSISPNAQEELQSCINYWNSNGYHPIEYFTDDRKIELIKIIKQYGLTKVFRAMDKIKESDYLQGKVNGFYINFDWFIDKKNFCRVLEGNYDNHEPKNNKENLENKSETYADMDEFEKSILSN